MKDEKKSIQAKGDRMGGAGAVKEQAVYWTFWSSLVSPLRNEWDKAVAYGRRGRGEVSF